MLNEIYYYTIMHYIVKDIVYNLRVKKSYKIIFDKLNLKAKKAI